MCAKWLIVVTATGASLLSILMMAQGLPKQGPPANAKLAGHAPKAPLPGKEPPKGKVLATNITAVVEIHQPSQAGGLDGVRNLSAPFLKPGLYRTTPYACIVMVPENSFDPHLAVRPPESALVAPMPMFKPELNFIPLVSK
jgi:hypothetical protein